MKNFLALWFLSGMIFAMIQKPKAQQTTKPQGDKRLSVWLTSDDTTKVKVYNGDANGHDPTIHVSMLSLGVPSGGDIRPVKYDTIGPEWRLVSDTAKGRWNPVSAMQVYEIRRYIPSPYLKDSNLGGTLFPEHFKWLDSNKRSLYMAVWPLNPQ